jgi:hypothetical protein
MDRRLRRAPDTKWVLMYRLGLSRQRIDKLVRAHPALVGYHLVIARRQDPGLEAAHQAASGARTGPSPGSLARMDEVITWIRSEGRLPRDRSEHQEERSMARWLSERLREAADGTLSPACRDGLAPVPGWAVNPRAAADEARWHDRLAQLADFRAEGNAWPRHHHYASEREHTLGVWIHTQRYKHRPRRTGPRQDQALGSGRSRLADRKDPGPPIPAVNAGPAPGPADSPLNVPRALDSLRLSSPPSLESREPPRLSP